MNPPRIGRPPSENPRTKLLTLRLTVEEHALIAEVAGYTDEPIGVWARAKLLAAARRAQRG